VWTKLSNAPINQRIDQVRVPEEVYQENLISIRQVFEENNISVYFVTAPSAHANFGVPENTISNGFAKDAESVIRLHRTYNQITRELAGENLLIDLEAEFERVQVELLREWFEEDGIHPTPTGTDKIAKSICDFILQGLRALNE
jgi:lysophospholipase L1-like esterase